MHTLKPSDYANKLWRCLMWKCPKCGKEFKNTNQNHYCGEKPKSIEEYILCQDPEKQADLFLVRQTLQQALPDAEERISWSMPTTGKNITFSILLPPKRTSAFIPVRKPWHNLKRNCRTIKRIREPYAFPMEI